MTEFFMQIVRFYANLPIHKHQLNLSLTVICQCISQIEIILKFKLFSVQSPTFKYILEKRRYQKQQIYSFGTSWFIFRSKYKETMLCPQSSFCNSSVLWSAQRPDHAAYLKVLRSYPTKKSHVSDLATTWLLFKGAMLLARSFESYTSGQS